MQLTKQIKEKFDIPNDPDHAWVEIKHLKINEVKSISAKANSMSFSADENGSSHTRVDFDPYISSKMLAHASILNWGGMKDMFGKPLECDRKGIEKAGEFVVTIEIEGKQVEFDFYGWIGKCRQELADTAKQEMEVAKEN